MTTEDGYRSNNSYNKMKTKFVESIKEETKKSFLQL